MRKFLTLFCFYFIGFNSIFSQVNPIKTLEDILAASVVFMRNFCAERNLEVVRVEADIIKDNNHKLTFRTLYNSYVYTVLIYSSHTIEEIDVEVYKEVDGNWVLVTNGDIIGDHEVVKIKPTTSGLYLIKIIGTKFKEGYDTGYYGMIIMHD